MAVRQVSNHGRNVIGHFPSLKMERMVAFESSLERDYLYLLDYDPKVEWFEEQPLTLEYRHEGQTYHYTPDFHVIHSQGHILVECKTSKFVDRAKNQRKFQTGRAWCAERSWEFRVVTEQQIRAGFRLRNIKLLRRYARYTIKPELSGRIYAWLHAAQSPVSIDDTVKALAPEASASVMANILPMAFRHELFVPLDEAPLSGQTIINLSARVRPGGQA